MSRHFSKEELACRCCDAMMFDERAYDHLEALRAVYGGPIPISSGYRCPLHNQEVASSGSNGPHTVIEASNVTIDVPIFGSAAWALVSAAMILRWPGIGLHQKGSHAGRMIHLDRCLPADGRPRPTVWTY